MIVELEETKKWLRIDGEDEDGIIQELIRAAEAYLYNATGKVFKETNYLARLFCMVLVADWYENREMIGSKPSYKARFTVQSMLAQLQYGDDVEGGDEDA